METQRLAFRYFTLSFLLLFVLAELKDFKTSCIHKKDLFLFVVHKFVKMCVSDHSLVARIIHPPDR